MKTKQFPDGLVELSMSGTSRPPDWVGQAGNCSSCWFSVNGGPWEPASSRSLHKNMQALDLADSVAEFRQYLEIV